MSKNHLLDCSYLACTLLNGNADDKGLMKNKLRILVIDDDEEMRKVLEFFLQKNGYEVRVAKNATDAFITFGIKRWDLLITDIVMPGISGLELIRTLQEISINIDFIVITGDDSPTNREEARLLGAKAFFVKPFDPEQLLSLIEITVQSHQRERQP